MDQILTQDTIAVVRSELACKISRLTPTLTEDESSRLIEMALSVLETLANDELPERLITNGAGSHCDGLSKETIDNKEAPDDKTQRLFDEGKLDDSAIKILKKKIEPRLFR